jgi:spermidine synthase
MNSRVWKIAPLLFGSGFCALVYQTAWQRELRLIFGASTAASAAVLAIFMGGLGLGGALLGARVDRDKRPLAFYADLEMVIALSTALTPMLVGMVRWLYVALGGTVTLGLVGGSVVRLLLSSLVLAGPTLLMGGTLPAAARAAETPEDVRRRALAVLYGLNTLGAVAGATASTFLLFEVFGTRSTLWLSCLLNVVVALMARTVARGLPDQETAAAVPAVAEAPAPGAMAPAVGALPSRRFVLAAAALVGFAFFLMEMVWYRMLSPLLGGSTFTFGLILMVALAGIGLGGAAYASWGQQRPATLRGFALTCVLEALLLAVPLALGDRIAVLASLTRSLTLFGFGGLVLGWTVTAVLVVFPAAFVSGVQFPLLLALLGRGGDHVGRQVGLAYAWNTVGSIVGSLAGGFGLLPLLTAPGVWRLVGAVLVLLGLAAVGLSLREERASLPRQAFTVLAAALTAVLLSAEGPTAAWRHSGVGAGRSRLGAQSTNELHNAISNVQRSLLWEADGVESSVAVIVNDGMAFLVNGKSDGSAIGDSGTQVMGGLIGALAHPNPRTSLVIGLGTGSTAGWLASVPEMERVDTVELEPAITEVARLCQDVNEHVLDNPKVHLFYGDAREVLLASKRTYDIIFSEPSNPYRAGISSLFSREFYQAVRRRMAPGGIFLQWVQAYEIDALTVRSIYATLSSEFGAVETWQTQRGDLILMATEAPWKHDVERMRARATQEPYRRALPATWYVDDAEGVMAHFLGGPLLAHRLAEGQDDLINTDDLSYVEFAFARSVGRSETGFSPMTLHQLALELGADRVEVGRGAVDWQRVAELRLIGNASWPLPPRKDLKPDVLQARRDFVLAAEKTDPGDVMARWRQAPWQPRAPSELKLVSEVLVRAGDDSVLPLLERLEVTRPFDARQLRARLQLNQGHLPEATQSLESAFALIRQTPWGALEPFKYTPGMVERITRQDKALGERLWSMLDKPLNSYRDEINRKQLLLSLMPLLDFRQKCTQAISPFEPHVPWTQRFLEARARCYVQTQNALEDQALEDLARFMAEQPPPLLPH